MKTIITVLLCILAVLLVGLGFWYMGWEPMVREHGNFAVIMSAACAVAAVIFVRSVQK